MSVGNKPGMIKTPNLGLNTGTSRGFMDNKTAGENWDKLDLSVGAVQEKRYLITWNPSLLVDNTWTYVPLPSDVAAAIGEAAFDGVIRFSNVVKILCCRLRGLCNTPGSGGVIQFQLRKGGNTAPIANELLLNPVEMDDSVATVQNMSGKGKPSPQTPVVGADADAISLWAKVDAVVDETDMDLEAIVMAQVVEDQPPASIIEP